MSDLIRRLRSNKAGEYFIDNTADRAWQSWMRGMLADCLEAADRLEELRDALTEERARGDLTQQGKPK